jgi:phage tail protein X
MRKVRTRRDDELPSLHFRYYGKDMLTALNVDEAGREALLV